MTVAELQKAVAACQKAIAHSEALLEARNAAIREALADGWTHQQIADATGLTRGRINQIR